MIVEGLVIWVVAFPTTKELLISIPSIMRARPQNLALEVVKNAVTLLLMGFPLAMIVAVHLLARYWFAQIPFGDFREITFFACVCGCVLLLSLFHFLLGVGLKALLKWRGWWIRFSPPRSFTRPHRSIAEVVAIRGKQETLCSLWLINQEGPVPKGYALDYFCDTIYLMHEAINPLMWTPKLIWIDLCNPNPAGTLLSACARLSSLWAAKDPDLTAPVHVE